MAGWFGGQNDYDSCILESMKGVTSDVAARMIRNSCRQKFPEKAKEDAVLLPQSAKQKIDGKGNGSSSGYFRGTLFNGDNEWTVTSIEVRITDNKTKTFRDYKHEIPALAPMSTDEFIFKAFDLPVDLSWDLLNVYGYPSNKN